MTKKDKFNDELRDLFSTNVFVINEQLYTNAEQNTYDKKVITTWVATNCNKFTLGELLKAGIIKETKPYRSHRVVYTTWSLENLKSTFQARNIDDYNEVHKYIKEII